MLMPRMMMMAYMMSKADVPSSPVSSAMLVKMKSETATGTKAGLPKPGPVPKRPPDATAICA